MQAKNLCYNLGRRFVYEFMSSLRNEQQLSNADVIDVGDIVQRGNRRNSGSIPNRNGCKCITRFYCISFREGVVPLPVVEPLPPSAGIATATGTVN